MSRRALDNSVGTGAGLAMGSVAAVQFGATVAEHLFARVGPVGTVSLRLGTAAVMLLLATRPWRHTWTRTDLAGSVLFGLSFAGMNTALYAAIDRLPLATVITLEFLGPLTLSIVTAGSWAVRVWALPAAAGVVLLGGTLSGGDVAGVVLSLSAACCWAAYILASGRVGRTGAGLSGLAVAIAIAAVIVLPFGIAEAGSGLVRPSTLGIGCAVGLLSSAVPYTLDLLALRRLPTAVFGVLASLNPAVAALAGYLVLDQTVGARALGGLALVSVASIGVTVTPAVRRARATRRGTVPEPVLDQPVAAA